MVMIVMKKNKFIFIGLSIISGLLLFFSWPPLPFTYFIFFALIPLLYINHKIITERLSALNYIYIYIAFLIWNIGSTHWICKMNFLGSLIIFLINSFLLTLPFIVAFYGSKLLKFKFYSNLVFIILFWLSIEYLQEKWQLAWPFYTLGNCFSMHPFIIQWYEYTGVLGGTLWILLVNYSFYEALIIIKQKNKYRLINLFISAFIVFIPILLSSIIYKNYKEQGKSVEILIVHPYLSCYTQKYNNSLSVDQQIQHHLDLTKSCITSSTDYILWPETAIPNIDWIELFSENKDIKNIREFIKKYPKVKLITGAIGFELYKAGKALPTKFEKYELKFSEKFNVWYYTYNLAIQLDTSLNIPFHTKQKLVPFEERTPYPTIFKKVQNTIGSLGNFNFTYRKKDELFLSSDSIVVLPLICYESLFSEYTAEKVKNKANILFVILNEGWYANTFGSKQFHYFSAIRAIENRRSIARSSNYGISGFINQKGEIIQSISSKNPDAIKGTLFVNDNKTYYSIHGNFIGKFSVYISISLIDYISFDFIFKTIV